MEKFNRTRIDTILNTILVKEGIRRACMLQPQDIGEAYHSDTNTHRLLEELIHIFPTLHFSYDYTMYQGIIISQEDFTGRHDIDAIEMGNILGYPCAKEFKEFNENTDKESYWINLNAITDTHKAIPLLSNGCMSLYTIPLFEDYAIKAKEAFLKPKNIDIIKKLGITIVDVVVTVEVKPTNSIIIHKLINYIPLSEKEIEYIYNEIYNLIGVDELSSTFDISNPIHKGMILGLLVQSTHNVLEPFFPIQTRKEYAAILDISKEWESALSTVIQETGYVTTKSRVSDDGEFGKKKRTIKKRRISKKKIKQYKK